MATVIDLPGPGPRSLPYASRGPISPSVAARPLGLFVAIVVVVLFFTAVKTVQSGAAAAASSESQGESVAVSPALPGRIEVGFGAAGSESLVASGVVIVGVVEGDSLWSIATELRPNEDPRPLVAAMIEANGGSTVQIGQEIVIPVELLGDASALR